MMVKQSDALTAIRLHFLKPGLTHVGCFIPKQGLIIPRLNKAERTMMYKILLEHKIKLKRFRTARGDDSSHPRLRPIKIFFQL